MPVAPTFTKKLRSIQLAALIFLTVSGGPYGLEPLLNQVGGGLALLLLIAVPLAWDIPTILTILELNSMMPVTGGYYQWVKRALGLRFGFYEGWWTWLYTFADLAIYPVLFVQYLSYFFPHIGLYKIPICLAIIWLSAAINLLGIVLVGRVSLMLSALVLLPFLLLSGQYLWQHGGVLHFPKLSLNGKPFSSIGIGLYTVMWNFIGWDNVTTYAAEVQQPVRSYIRSITLAFTTIFTLYFLTVLITINTGVDAALLEEQGFPLLGQISGGQWLGAALAIGGMGSALGLYAAVLLSVSRIPRAMAQDGLLPAKVYALHPRYGSPYVSVLCCSVVVSGMIFWTFGELLIIDITLYGAALFLEYVALIRLRQAAPDDLRPFRIPLGVPGLVALAVLPFSVYGIAVAAALTDSAHSLRALAFAVAALGSAEVVWQLIRLRKRALQ